MGLSDREYFRGEDEHGHSRGFSLGGGAGGGGGSVGQLMVTRLVIINAALWIANLLTDGNLTKSLTLRPENLAEPWMWWRLISYGFAHDPDSLWHLLGNMLGLWFLGRHVEMVYGRKEFLRLYLVSMVLCGVAWAARGMYFLPPETAIGLLGASGAVTAVIILFVFHFPKVTVLVMFIPMPAWVLGVLLILSNLMRAQGSNVAYDVHLVGAAFGACYFYFGWNFGRLVPGGFSVPSVRRKPKLRVHNPDSTPDEPDLKDESGDRVLEKIHREGEESLTPRERKILEAYSRRMQQKHR